VIMSRLTRLYAVLAITFGVVAYAWAANNIRIQGAGASYELKTTDNSGVHTPHVNVDSIASGAQVDLLTMRGTKAPGTAAANSLLAGGIYTSAGVTLTDGQQAALQMSSAGLLLTSAVGGATSDLQTAGNDALGDILGAINSSSAETTAPGTGASQMLGVQGATGMVPLDIKGTGTAGTAATGVVTVQGIASMTPLLATLSGTNNITNISGTVSLPTGASTAAKQPALGTAGSASSDVITVQGVASMTPLLANPGTAANWAVGPTASAPPANAVYQGASVGGNLTGLVGCNSVAKYDASTSGSTQIVALTSTQTIRICGYSIMSGGTANVKLVSGTGSNCATSPTDITPAWQLTAQAGIVDRSVYWQGLAAVVSEALCINASAGVAVQALVYYSKS
jgi:hypothetical protein